MSIAILLHTHSEYSFLWKAAIPLLEKYAPDYTIYWLCDTLLDYTLPSNFIPCFYDPSLVWSTRLRNCLENIPNEYVLFLHEDWLATGPVEPEKINYCLQFMKDKDCSMLMSHLAHYYNRAVEKSIYENYIFVKVYHHYIQPAIWKKSAFLHVLGTDYPLTESETARINELVGKYNCYTIVNTQCVDISTATLFYPHSHAMFQGKWTFIKHPDLKDLVESYGIDTSKRSVDDLWMVGSWLRCAGVFCNKQHFPEIPRYFNLSCIE